MKGLFWELNPGPLAPEARIIPLDQTANVSGILSQASMGIQRPTWGGQEMNCDARLMLQAGYWARVTEV